MKLKQRCRDRVWWPGIDREIEALVKDCSACLVSGKTGHSPPPPLQLLAWPSRPWQHLQLDICGEIHGVPHNQLYLVVVYDLHSKWHEYFLLSTIFYLLFFSHTQHNIIFKIQQNKTKQQTHTQHLKVQSNGRGRGKDNKNTKVTPLYNHVCPTKKHCQASMVEGLAPPTRAVVHSHDTICRRLWIQYVLLHMCGVNQFWIIVFFTAVKPANNILFC